MMLDSAETLVRRAGGAGLLIDAVAIYAGLLRGTRRAKGRTSGRAPAGLRWFARLQASGSPLFYVLMTVPSLAVLRLLWRPLPLRFGRAGRAVALVLGAALYFPGLALMLWGRLALGEMHNLSSSVRAELYADQRLITTGPYALLRHPMYLGGMMAEIGALLLYRTWTTAFIAVNAPLLPLRARREEEALHAEFGEQWEGYARRVPPWLPRLHTPRRPCAS